MTRIAITGGSGFIGRSLVRRLVGSRRECLVLGRQSGVERTGPEGSEAPYRTTDYSVEDLAESFDGVAAVVHLAARRYLPGETMTDHLPSLEVAAHVAEACRIAGVPDLVHLSTIGVYGASPDTPWTERTLPAPRTFYAVAKLAAEGVAECEANRSALRVKNLRVAQVLGAGERRGFMLAKFFERALRGQALEVWGRGRGARDYVDVEDVAGAVVRALETPEATGTFNVGGGRAVSHRELAETVNRVFENPAGITLREDLEEDESRLVMDGEWTAARLGWKPRRTLEESLVEIRARLSEAAGTRGESDRGSPSA